MVKPVNSKRQQVVQKAEVKRTEPEKTKIGGVEFRKDHIEKATTYTENGKKMNSVFVRPGVRIDYPDQTGKGKNPSVESLGVRDEWYNPDASHIHISDLENAKIYGNKNKDDYIILKGKSENNEIFVDQKESWFASKGVRRDNVDLGLDTKNNTVHMDETDKTQIWYYQTGIIMGGEEVQASIGGLTVEGKGTSEQEPQLKEALGNNYKLHKHLQDK